MEFIKIVINDRKLLFWTLITVYIICNLIKKIVCNKLRIKIWLKKHNIGKKYNGW